MDVFGALVHELIGLNRVLQLYLLGQLVLHIASLLLLPLLLPEHALLGLFRAEVGLVVLALTKFEFSLATV